MQPPAVPGAPKVDIASLLGDDAAYLLDHVSTTISADQLTTPGPDSVSEVFAQSDRPP